MKVSSLLLLALLLTGSAFAQTPAKTEDAPGVTVTRTSWHKDVFIPALYDDPMQPNADQVELRREQKVIAKRMSQRGQAQAAPLPTRAVMTSGRDLPPGPSTNYTYEAKITNSGSKTILGIVWVHLFFDPETDVEVGRHRFGDDVKIRPGKTTTLVGLTASPPTSVVQVTVSGKELRLKYAERVVIDRLEYEDGTFWQRSPE